MCMAPCISRSSYWYFTKGFVFFQSDWKVPKALLTSKMHELASLEMALSWKRTRVIKVIITTGNKRKKSSAFTF